MEAVDQFVIEDIQKKLKNQGGGMRTLVVECLMSEIFRSR
jgi:hypothetical protein